MSDTPQRPEWPASEPTPVQPPPGGASPGSPPPPPGAPPQGMPPPPGGTPGQWGPQDGSPAGPPTTPPPTSQGMPGWAKGCLIAAGVGVVLFIIAVIALFAFGRQVVSEVETSGQDAEALAVEYLDDVRATGGSPLACPGWSPSANLVNRITESSGESLDGFGIMGESAVVGVLHLPDGDVPISVFVTSSLGDELCIADVTLQ